MMWNTLVDIWGKWGIVGHPTDGQALIMRDVNSMRQLR